MTEIENEKLLELVSNVFVLESRHGHLKWKVSELARNCQVSRPSVYYHLGRNKKEILHSCLDIIASEFYGLSPNRTDQVRKGELVESIKYSRKLFLQTPELTVFYIKWTNTKSDIQKKLADTDRRYQQRLKNLFPHLTSQQLTALQAVFHGIITTPIVDDETITEVLKWLPLKA